MVAPGQPARRRGGAARRRRLLAALRGAGDAGVGAGVRADADDAGPDGAVEAVPRPVDRRVVARPRAGDEHRAVRAAPGEVPRPVAGQRGAGEEGGRAVDRRRAPGAQPRLAHAAHVGGLPDRRPRRAPRAPGGRHRGGAQAAERHGAYRGAGAQGDQMIGKTIGDLAPGDHAEIVRRVEMEDITEFVDAVGDYNPIHGDPRFAAATPFRVPIAPGVYTAGLISAVIGTQLPGPGAIYLSQSLKFLKPVKPGDVITTRVEVLEVIRERNRMRLSTVCTNQGGEEVLTGEAWVMPSKTPVVYEAPPREPASLGLFAPWAWAAQAMALWGTVGLAMLGAG